MHSTSKLTHASSASLEDTRRFMKLKGECAPEDVRGRAGVDGRLFGVEGRLFTELGVPGRE